MVSRQELALPRGTILMKSARRLNGVEKLCTQAGGAVVPMKASLKVFGLAATLAWAATISVAPAEPAGPELQAVAAKCSAPADLTRLPLPLKRMSQHVAGGQPLTIVAMGSSSTFGAGASSPERSYPSRLGVELKALFPRLPITVINHGVNGEESKDMLARFDHDVFGEKPDLVLWQVGSNSVLRDRPLAEANASLRAGLKRLHDAGIDVVLINPQYAPKVITKHDVDGMVSLIDITAKEANVDLFPRFAIMRHWMQTQAMPFSAFLSPDNLHMNDWGYGCWAKLLAGSLHEAATRATTTAVAAPARR
jgi:lysophospholipase L1-like esterase